jgi:TRAP-type transport system small permease protein
MLHTHTEVMSVTAAAGARPALLTRLNAQLARICMITAVSGLFALVFVVIWQVFGRYVLNDTPAWAESLALVLVIYITMLGAAAGVRDAGHISIDSMLVLLPERLRLKFEVLIHFLVGVFGGLMAWYGQILGRSVMNYKIPTLGLSEATNYAALVVAGTLIVLFSIEHIVALFNGKEVVPSWH